MCSMGHSRATRRRPTRRARSSRIAQFAHDLSRTRLAYNRYRFPGALQPFPQARPFRHSLQFPLEIVGKAHSLLRCAGLQYLMQRLWYVSHLDHLGHVLHMITCAPHAPEIDYPRAFRFVAAFTGCCSVISVSEAAGFLAMARLCFNASIMSTIFEGSFGGGATTSCPLTLASISACRLSR